MWTDWCQGRGWVDILVSREGLGGQIGVKGGVGWTDWCQGRGCVDRLVSREGLCGQNGVKGGAGWTEWCQGRGWVDRMVSREGLCGQIGVKGSPFQAEDNGLLFMPIAGQKQYEGKALYSFGKVAVYIDRGVVFAKNVDNIWLPVSLDKLLELAR